MHRWTISIIQSRLGILPEIVIAGHEVSQGTVARLSHHNRNLFISITIHSTTKRTAVYFKPTGSMHCLDQVQRSHFSTTFLATFQYRTFSVCRAARGQEWSRLGFVVVLSRAPCHSWFLSPALALLFGRLLMLVLFGSRPLFVMTGVPPKYIHIERRAM